MYEVKIVDALAGSGKTYQAIQWAVKKAHYFNENTVIVFKSKALIKEAWKTLAEAQTRLESKAPTRRIDQDHLGNNKNGIANKSVKAAITDYLQNIDQQSGNILFITEAAFLDLPFWSKRWMWHCILDEIPTASTSCQLNVPDHHKMLTEYLVLDKATPAHSVVKTNAEGESKLRAYADNKNIDEISAYFSPLAKEIISPHYEVYTLDQSYQRLLAGDSVGGSYGLQFFSILKPTIFGSRETKSHPSLDGRFVKHLDQFKTITVMGACLKDSLMYYLWKLEDADFIEHDEISKGLRYDRHACGNRVKIRYLFDDKWSKHKRDGFYELDDKKITTLEILVAAIKSEFDASGFVYMVNKDKEDIVRADLINHNGVQLPNSPYGLNEFQHIHQATVLSALNTTPAHFKFLDMMGVDGDAVTESMYYQACYQAIMRTSLRNPNATEDVKIIVGDKPAAMFLQDIFSGAEVRSIITNAKALEKRRKGRPKSSSTKSRAETVITSKQTAKSLKTLEDQILNGETVDPVHLSLKLLQAGSANTTAERIRELYEGNLRKPNEAARKIAVPLFESIYKSTAEDLIEISIDQCDEFIDLLEGISKRKLPFKHANLLISTTEFNEKASRETNRGLENFVKAWGIWLDLDGGVLSPDDLSKILPDIRMVMFNSWSDGNYRVFIPTTKFMSRDSYKEIVQTIIFMVEQTAPDEEMRRAFAEGRKPRCYVSSKQALKQLQSGKEPHPIHGIDLSKVTPTSMFYLPCVCGSNPDWSFFWDYNEATRQTLNPEFWIQNSILPQSSPEPQFLAEELEEFRKAASKLANDNRPTDKSKIIEEAINTYKTIPDGCGRHNAYFKAIWSIHFRAKVPIHDLDQYMIECDYDNHQQKRYGQIKKDLASGRYGTRAA